MEKISNLVPLKVYISKELNQKLRGLIQQKYKEYEKGLLSYEVDAALRHWLSLHTGAQNSIESNIPNPTPKVKVHFFQVKEYLMKNFYFELSSGQQIPRTQLEKAIMDTQGSDKRTIRKWFGIFQRMGLIKMVTSATWEIM